MTTSSGYLARRSLSTGGFIAGSLIATQMAAAAPNLDSEWPSMSEPMMLDNNIPSTQHISTNYIIEITDGLSDEQFAKTIANYYAALEDRQEELGEPFQSLLYENLSTLYEE